MEPNVDPGGWGEGCGGDPSDATLTATFAPLLGRRLALCVSGGADSIALMHLVARWAGLPHVEAAWRNYEPQQMGAGRDPAAARMPMPMPPTLAVEAEWATRRIQSSCDAPHEPPCWPPIVVLTVDHGLRAGSTEEAVFVKHAARRLGLPHQTLAWTGAKPRTGLQQAAREARYRLLSEVLEAEWWARLRAGDGACGDAGAGKSGRRVLVTAHHLEDQAETFLMRLARGTTLDGLAAMRTLETFWMAPGPGRAYRSCYQVCRPLLGVPRTALKAYLHHQGQTWREDPSNADPVYERVRVRSALPVLAGLGIGVKAIGLTAARLELSRENLRSRVEDDVREALVQVEPGIYGRLRRSALAGLPLDRVMRVLRAVLAAYGGAASPPEYRQLVVLAEGLREGKAIGKQTLAGCVLAPPSARRGGLDGDVLVWREPGRLTATGVPLAPGHFVDWDGGRFRVEARSAAPDTVMVGALGGEGWREVRRRVPSLELVHFPTGAPQTLPAIRNGADLIAVPGLGGTWVGAQGDSQGVPGAGPEAVHRAIGQEWDAAFGLTDRLYNAEFTGVRTALDEAGGRDGCS